MALEHASARVDRSNLAARDRVSRALLEGIEHDFLLAFGLGGIRAALGWLNARTRFRFTALCPMDPGNIWIATLYDRENPRGYLQDSENELRTVARAIACECAANRCAPDGVSRGARDQAPFAVASSHIGAPVLTEDGTSCGVLFHYDLRLRLAARNERRVLDHLGSRLAQLCPAVIGCPRGVDPAI